MTLQFGAVRAPSVARDHVFPALGGRTVDDALNDGADPKWVWTVVCDTFEVPHSMRHGMPDDEQ